MTPLDTPPARVWNKALWAGRILSAIPVLMLLVSGAMKVVKPAFVVEGFTTLGWPEQYTLGLGLLELACTAVYVIPRTSILGAILLTGYLGGATATHVRLGDPSLLGAVILGVLVWLGLYWRDTRLRALVPLRS